MASAASGVAVARAGAVALAVTVEVVMVAAAAVHSMDSILAVLVSGLIDTAGKCCHKHK